jgi:hypothetical protein
VNSGSTLRGAVDRKLRDKGSEDSNQQVPGTIYCGQAAKYFNISVPWSHSVEEGGGGGLAAGNQLRV